jgi:hypothetical protein
MIDAVANSDSDASLRTAYPGKRMKPKLYEKIGASIAKADPLGDDGPDMPDDSAEESDESPGAQLAEALGITDADATAVDAALRAAIRQLK